MRVLMCPPLYFEVQEENSMLNPWMKKECQPNKTTAIQQWCGLVNAYTHLGFEVFMIQPEPDLGDMCFSANAAWCRNNTFFMSNFHQSINWRHREISHYSKWLVRNTFNVQFLPDNLYFEGQGDIITLNSHHVFGHGHRNSPEVEGYLDTHFRLKTIVPVELVDARLYHLDMSMHFMPGADAVLWCPDAFDAFSQRQIEKIFDKEGLSCLEFAPNETIQEVGEGRVNFLLNSTYFDKNEIIGWDENYSELPLKFRNFLEWRGIKILPVNVSEFGLSGGGLRCLTLFLD